MSTTPDDVLRQEAARRGEALGGSVELALVRLFGPFDPSDRLVREDRRHTFGHTYSPVWDGDATILLPSGPSDASPDAPSAWWWDVVTGLPVRPAIASRRAAPRPPQPPEAASPWGGYHAAIVGSRHNQQPAGWLSVELYEPVQSAVLVSRRLEDPTYFFDDACDPLDHVTLWGDGTLVAIDHLRHVFHWDLGANALCSRAEIAVADGHPVTWDMKGISAFAPCPGRRWILVGLGNGQLALLDLGGPLRVVDLPRLHDRAMAASWHPTKPLVATFGDEGAVCVWRVPECSLVAHYQAQPGPQWGHAWSPDGRLLAWVAGHVARVFVTP